ncbi:MAG: tRNA uridine-5-carboxymethylaminomethyl(34) synthesis enzyme MnmG [bacterium]
MKKFDIVILGCGHAGLEAANMAAQFNLNIGIITLPEVPIASAPCNPAVGGVAKGQLVREIDALGGVIGKLSDLAGIQYRTLNESKGYAIHSTRVQIDEKIYSTEAKKILNGFANVEIIQASIKEIIYNENESLAYTVITDSQNVVSSKSIIFTLGTFPNGKIYFGNEVQNAGRIGKRPSLGIRDIFSNIKIPICDLPFKTGTPPRIHRASINFTKLKEQSSSQCTRNFHYGHSPLERFQKQHSCYLTNTNSETMNIVRNNKSLSPMYSGQIQAVGTRYCPSIEDKADRYPDRDIHHVFLEPEGTDSDSFYPNGISSGLPPEVQQKFVRTIPGLENAEFIYPGYAITYDVIDTTFLSDTLEHTSFPGLYFAGQINGTSGYEEAAGQGLIAGANSALKIISGNPLVVNRYDSYLGVLIHDLISNTRDEPYRLFTSRAENRLQLREDNTLMRMYPYRSSLLLNSKVDEYQRKTVEEISLLQDLCGKIAYGDLNQIVKKYNGPKFRNTSRNIYLDELLRQPWLDPVEVCTKEIQSNFLDFSYDAIKAVAINIKYGGYVKKSLELLQRVQKLDSKKINWKKLGQSNQISFECRMRINKIKPDNFGQLRTINGIRPATLAYVAGSF